MSVIFPLDCWLPCGLLLISLEDIDDGYLEIGSLWLNGIDMVLPCEVLWFICV